MVLQIVKRVSHSSFYNWSPYRFQNPPIIDSSLFIEDSNGSSILVGLLNSPNYLTMCNLLTNRQLLFLETNSFLQPSNTIANYMWYCIAQLFCGDMPKTRKPCLHSCRGACSNMCFFVEGSGVCNLTLVWDTCSSFWRVVIFETLEARQDWIICSELWAVPCRWQGKALWGDLPGGKGTTVIVLESYRPGTSVMKTTNRAPLPH